MADAFMENRAQPIDPVNFGVQDAVSGMPDALVRAYKYLSEKDRQLKAPARAAIGGLSTGAALIQDYLSNMAASAMGAKRPDPNAAAAAAIKKAAPAFADLADANKSLTDTLQGGRQGVVNALGWQNLPTVAAEPVPSPAVASPAPAPAAPASTPGALPVKRIPVARPAIGALQSIQPPPVADTPGNGDLYAPQAGGNTAPEAVGGGGIVPLPPQAAEPPAKSLRDEYLKRVAGMEKPTPAGMTEEQKGQALMEAGLAIMSAASRHGASALGAVGEGGMKGTAVAREMEKINREQADKARLENRANVGEEFKLAGEDAKLALERQRRDEDRAARIQDQAERSADRKDRNANESKRIDLLGQQVDAAGWQLKDGADGVVHAYNVRTGEDRKTPLKVKPDASQRNQQIEFYKFLMDNPTAQSLFTKSDTIDIKDEGKLRSAYASAYLKASMDPNMSGDISKFPTFDEYKSKLTAGGGGGPPKFNTVAEVQAAKKAGTIKVGDTIITPQGPGVVR